MSENVVVVHCGEERAEPTGNVNLQYVPTPS